MTNPKGSINDARLAAKTYGKGQQPLVANATNQQANREVEVCMSSLTRQLQKQLVRYVQRSAKIDTPCDPAHVRNELISKGVCPSSVTEGQMRQILEVAGLM